MSLEWCKDYPESMNHFQQRGCFPASAHLGHPGSSHPLVSSVSFGFQSFHYRSLSSPWLGLFLDSVDVIIKAIVFPISFLVSSFLVLRESTDFQVLILSSAALLNF